MGFIEDLRQKRAAEASAKAAKEEAERRARVSQQEYDRRERENARLRTQSLERSQANGIIQGLRREPGVYVEDTENAPGIMRVEIRDLSYGGDKFDFFSVRGNEDGSVTIGKTTLNPEQAKDPKLVSDTFKKAHEKAETTYTPFGIRGSGEAPDGF